MIVSLYPEIRVLYRTTATHDEFTTLHGCKNGDDLLQLNQECQSNPHLYLTLNGCNFTARACIIDGHPSFATDNAVMYHYQFDHGSHKTGLVGMANGLEAVSTPKASTGSPRLSFRDYFALILLTQPPMASRLPDPSTLYPLPDIAQTNDWVDAVCQEFESSLLFRAPHGDHWDEGKFSFSRSKIRFALPAFPCKSYNPDKVAGIWPDGGEFEALANIYQFCSAVIDKYPPGCVFEIVSDGHVFSDCIGVDDDVVTEYGERLRETAASVRELLSREDLEDVVTFNSLHDILAPEPWIQPFFQGSFARLEATKHPVTTARCEQDDINRGILLHSCSADHAQLQHTIRSDPTHSMTMLYRGFSRFMLDDLAAHSDCKDKSKSQRKKLSEKVALEMMHRNQAYSHLVELAMPRHVRLSIHAHNNKGPKFAVSILPQRVFKPLTSFDGLRLSTKYNQYDEKHHLHIPTPWHNCLVQIHGEDAMYVCKAVLVKAELAGSMWSSRSRYQADHARGGRYVLYRRAENVKSWDMAPSTPEEDEVAVV